MGHSVPHHAPCLVQTITSALHATSSHSPRRSPAVQPINKSLCHEHCWTAPEQPQLPACCRSQRSPWPPAGPQSPGWAALQLLQKLPGQLPQQLLAQLPAAAAPRAAPQTSVAFPGPARPVHPDAPPASLAPSRPRHSTWKASTGCPPVGSTVLVSACLGTACDNTCLVLSPVTLDWQTLGLLEGQQASYACHSCHAYAPMPCPKSALHCGLGAVPSPGTQLQVHC